MLLMKRGGQTIYMGPLGRQSHKLVAYFEVSMDFQNLWNLLKIITCGWIVYKSLTNPFADLCTKPELTVEFLRFL